MMGIRLQETRVYQEAQAEAVLTLILRLLTRRLKQDLSEELKTRLAALSLPNLEALAEALLDFSSLTDSEAWLAANT